MARRGGVSHWREEFLEWLSPFLEAFGRVEQRYWVPKYLEGLLGPGDRKSIEPMAERVCPGDTQQLHHFVSTSPWATAPLEQVLAETADALVGGPEAVLIIDDTALPKQGRHSAGVARQYCRRPRQAGELPGARLAHPGPARGARATRARALPAGGVGE